METVISVLQTALTPAFLLVALGSLLNLFTGRLARIVDRSRALETRYPESEPDERVLIVRELHIIERRNAIVSRAILLGVLAALAVCVMIGLLFMMGLVALHLATAVIVTFMIALALMAGALILFAIEVRIATKTVHVREEFLELEKGQRHPGRPLTRL